MNGFDFRDNEKPVKNDTYGTVSTNFFLKTCLHCKNKFNFTPNLVAVELPLILVYSITALQLQ